MTGFQNIVCTTFCTGGNSCTLMPAPASCYIVPRTMLLKFCEGYFSSIAWTDHPCRRAAIDNDVIITFDLQNAPGTARVNYKHGPWTRMPTMTPYSWTVSTEQVCLLWSPYGIRQTIIFSSSGFFFFSSPNLSRHRLDVCHTSTHGVALVRI